MKCNRTCLVSIFIPAYNESENIPAIFDKIQKIIEKDSDNCYELIIVDDGSTDDSKSKISEGMEKYSFIKPYFHKKNLGLTEAMRTGFPQCKGEFVLFIPGDLESDPEEDIPLLLNKLKEGYDLVTGWRQGRNDGKMLASKIYNTVSRKLFHVNVHDMNWIKGFRKCVIEDLELRSDWHRFIVMMAVNKGYKITEVKTNWHHRKYGKSKFGLMRFPVSMIDVLVVKFNMVFGNKPMQFFSLLGAVTIFIGILGLIYLAAYYFATNTQIRPLFTLFTTMIIAGVQLFVTGFIAELVVTLRADLENLKNKIEKQKNDGQ
ncbi:MAG: glycosyltransferase family 2 protein [Candidatus Delongbacteria bacterium]|nr:glycosyltransferase family 2 protein [Candidatus Delongbacteria bacterium]MCG2760918.1 glycosyltransferase family 2 protein [Candidatus Delongbacteria bacterium]